MSNKSLDASGGSVFLNLRGAAKGALNRAAASTQPLGNLDRSMRRIVISLLAGIALTFGAPSVVALVLSRGDSNAIIPFLLYWPLSVTDKLGFGLDCGNADLISDKLRCMRGGLFIDVVFYPVAICACAYFIHRMSFRRRGRLRPSHVA